MAFPIQCARHASSDADYHCPECQEGFCSVCALTKRFARACMRVCPVCGLLLTPLAPYHPVPPFWTRLREIALFPISQGWHKLGGWILAVVMLRGIGDIGIFIGGPIAAFWGALLVAAYYSVLISYFFVVIARAEQGSLEVPEFADFPGVTPGMLWPILQFAIVVFMPAAPVLLLFLVAAASDAAHLRSLFTALDPLLVVVLGALVLCGALLVPMALIVLGISRSLLQALNPVLLVRQIVKIPKDYALATAGVAIVVSVGALWTLLLVLTMGSLEQPGAFLVVGLAMYLLDGAVQLYVFMVLGHLLGYLAHQTRLRLNWWSELPGELMVHGKPVQLRKEEQ